MNHGDEFSQTILVKQPGLQHSLLCLKPGQSSILHLHKQTLETYFVFEGEAEIQIGEKRTIIGPKELLSVPPGTPHKISNPGLFDLIVLSTKNSDMADSHPC